MEKLCGVLKDKNWRRSFFRRTCFEKVFGVGERENCGAHFFGGNPATTSLSVLLFALLGLV